MARRPPSLATIKRKEAVADLGYRPLTIAEHRELGIAPSKRLYTRQKAGVKKLREDMTAPRRRIEEEAIGRRYEAIAADKRAARAGMSTMDRATRYALAYRDREYARTVDAAIDSGDPIPKAPKGHEGIRAVQRAPEFKRLYKNATNNTGSGKPGSKKNRRERKATARRLEALRDFDVFNEDEFADLFTGYMGED